MRQLKGVPGLRGGTSIGGQGQRVGPSVPACITLHPNLPPDSPGGKEVLVVSPELKPGWRRPVRIRHCPNREKG